MEIEKRGVREVKYKGLATVQLHHPRELWAHDVHLGTTLTEPSMKQCRQI